MEELEYIQMDEDSFIPVIRIGQGTMGLRGGKKFQRPETICLELTHKTLRDVFQAEYKKEKFLRWLSSAVLPALKKDS